MRENTQKFLADRIQMLSKQLDMETGEKRSRTALQLQVFNKAFSRTSQTLRTDGGRGSGNHNHAGRIGKRGGSASRSALAAGKITHYGKTDTSGSDGADSLAKYKNPDGSLTEAREKLHRQIIDEVFKNAVKATGQPTFFMMGGGPASGKSTVLKQGFATKPDTPVEINADDIKAMLPEYQAMIKAGNDEAAGYCHEESSAIAKRIMSLAMEHGYNVVLDGTGDGSVESVEKKINEAKSRGMKVEAFYTTCGTEEALNREKARAAKSGRKVKEKVVRGTHKKVSAILPQVADKFDKVSLYNTETASGVPELIATGGGGKPLTTVAGQEAAMSAFLAKANE